MKKKGILLFVCCLVCTLGFSQNNTRFLTVEPNHSTIGFRIPISGGLTLVTGKFTEFDLELSLANGDWTQAQASFSIQVKSINTGIDERDKHLQSPDFFDVEKYPTITFVSEKITAIDSTHFVASGTFSMHGIEKNISLPFQVLGAEGNTIGIQIRTSLNRVDYEVGGGFQHSTMPDFLGNEVEVEINFWTKRDKRKD
ncbi:MAG: YceI family protein [Saprospiraceae bacterium]